MATDDKKVQNRLLNFFGITTVKDKEKEFIAPAVKNTQKDKRPRASKLPAPIKLLWDWYIKNNYDSNQTLKDRLIRYNDMDYAIYNSGILAMVMELYSDETVQSDSQNKIISVEASSKVKKEIERLLIAWGFDQPTLRSLAYNIVAYGDSFSVNTTKGKEGITDVTHVDPRDIKEKIEFKLSEVASLKRRKKSYSRAGDKRLEKLVKALKEDTISVSELYKTYILGYELEIGEVLPPWNVSHYKVETTKSEFFPYGKSLLLNSLSLFKQYQTSKNLEALLRAAKFPKEHFQVEIDQEASELEAWELVNEAREEYENLGIQTKEKDGFSAGTQIWTPKGLIEYDVIDSNINLDQIGDIELLRDELIISTRIPKGYLIVDRGSFGQSGQALLQQFKPFGRAVYSVQSIILKGIAQLLRLHFLMTGQFDEELTDFTLSMNFPVVEISSDRSRAQSDSLRLASDILSNIQNALGIRDGLPPEVIKSVFSQYSFLDSDDVEDWVDASFQATGEEGQPLVNESVLGKQEERKIRESITKEIFIESYLEALNSNHIQEAIIQGKHFINSSCAISPSEKQILDDCRTEIISTKNKKKIVD